MNDAPRRIVHCQQCDAALCAEVAGLQIVTRKGYEWTGVAHTIRCDRCGAVWYNPRLPAALSA